MKPIRARTRVCLGIVGFAMLASPLVMPVRGEIGANPYKKLFFLDFEERRPERIKLGSEPNVQNFFYLPFTLTNKDDTPHNFFLEIAAESDKGVTYRSLDNQLVLGKIRRRMGLKPHETLWSVADYTTRHEDQPLPKGGQGFPTKVNLPVIEASQSVQCVAIFPGFHGEMDRLKITIRGLSNDVIIKKGEGPNERVLEERALVLEYERLGDEFYAQEDAVMFIGRRWETLRQVVKTDLE